jgi:hypothetical protein
MQTTLAFAPTPEDLSDIILEPPVLAASAPQPDDEQSEQGEP